METDRHIRRNFHNTGFCAYEIEIVQRPIGADEYEDRIVVRVSSGRDWVFVAFRPTETQSLVQFAKDILLMASRLE